MSMLSKINNIPTNPISKISKWGTEEQVSDFINDIWPINWTPKAFKNYLKHWKPADERKDK